MAAGMVLCARAQSPIVDLGYAQYQGAVSPANISHFLGIRYAAAPLGLSVARSPSLGCKINRRSSEAISASAPHSRRRMTLVCRTPRSSRTNASKHRSTAWTRTAWHRRTRWKRAQLRSLFRQKTVCSSSACRSCTVNYSLMRHVWQCVLPERHRRNSGRRPPRACLDSRRRVRLLIAVACRFQ